MEELLQKIDWEKLENLGYRSQLGKSLKNTLRKFDKEELFEELRDMIRYYTCIAGEVPFEKRIKAIQSCELKYSKYYPSKEVEKVFNDILGIRITINSYASFDELELPCGSETADMRNGKASDDGYRGIHVYLQQDHFRYPIEVQFVTPMDKTFNEWLHDNTYKYVTDIEVGRKLRYLYEEGVIQNLEDFRKELRNVLSDSKKI